MAGISSASMAKLGKNENINTQILVKICEALECDTSDIMEIERNEYELEGKLNNRQKCFQQGRYDALIQIDEFIRETENECL